ncbi:putative membrane protein YfcA [Dyadobacter sp. BE34]|uniref:Probable membrane transporter protein n=1 Tax=Dyadobacter fermentans TaxID=94254 RepID=A0ABU1R886_9BACT|nr:MULTISPECIES: sulfite exporter TauE/SafE family protein [Dyadobacter]MDR6809622.1 putative membrane protein YfcA [Dyadobacter fermentans]MDR7047300.1 putative membrane protein YfcA [Dyadobacter sp. BE242]MDR7201536.1 putative membrane protein YfcA [Dyadobacter sp. BE34]MDR7219406.1 putative membrane protein YfcA [Dyadobacter sp. BE31]MDR7267200.1 putative membrane protein YfcA [Dyadobacter sp. BE32]
MDSTEVLGFSASILIGISLGLIGGGGSILTLPVLVYVMGINPVLSTAYSLFVVGTTSLAGSFNFMRKGLVNYKAALVFAIPSFVAVFLTRKYFVPMVPDSLFTVGGFEVTKDVAIMLFFAVVMLAASYSMIKEDKSGPLEVSRRPKFNYPLIGLEGGVVGMLTGVVGAGGGFLIIPALVLLAKLPMKMAVGTSLLVIAAKSLIGFAGDISNTTIDWTFLIEFTSLSILGIFLGSFLSRFISGEKLKKSFGWFVLAMGIYIISKEIFFKS